MAVKTQALQLETAERRQVALQQELATAKNDLQLLKMEADMALARERQAVVKVQAENLTLQQQMTALNQQALDHAQLTEPTSCYRRNLRHCAPKMKNWKRASYVSKRRMSL